MNERLESGHTTSQLRAHIDVRVSELIHENDLSNGTTRAATFHQISPERLLSLHKVKSATTQRPCTIKADHGSPAYIARD